ncbi:helix-turn-helix domain-containing protein [Sporosarcina aquimarina]|uniref:Helix-turn-helix domain-containing protein n=1 Tax=Sporosarcina aquimarina TaxID=114975 RepID=A0ABU4FWS2_9BACL|nr:RodZ domain-containing protein [Sporosarcina aquimarina]MDW0109164.1 helix-turn-helix domain-containing protein [Sporosarcina aquimarina]
MSELGNRLKEARNAKGYTLDDLQAITKIQKRYLAGIENEDYSIMPGSFYVRAFIKQYAEAVGLDAQEMLSLYRENESSVQMREEEVQRSAPQISQKPSYMKSSGFNEVLPKIIAALFIIVILVVVIFLYKHQADTQNNDEAETSNEITVDQKPDDQNAGESSDTDGEDANSAEDAEKPEEPAEESKEEKPEQKLTQAAVNGATTTFTLESADAFKLSVKVKEGGESWIGVTNPSGQELLKQGARVMKNGEAEELDLSDQQSARIRVGRTQFTEILVNGQPLAYPNDAVTQNIIIEYKK